MPGEENVENHGDTEHAHAGTITGAVEWGILVGEQEGRHDTGSIADGEMHTGRESSLAISGVVGGNPGKRNTTRHEDADRDETATSVRNSRALVGDEHGVSDNC